ncbi:MAG: alpha-ketoacid dehydrogenase subunit beta, partial [Planctomycetota bacterium]
MKRGPARTTGTRTIRYRDALREALLEEMRRDERVFVMGEGIGLRGGSYKVTVGLLDEFGPKRIVDTPLAEASFIGAGVGAAITGMRPVVEILFVDFAMLGMDQLVNQAAKFKFMTGNQGTVPMVLRTQGGTGSGVAAQHSQSLEGLFYHIPGLKLAVPSTPYDAKGLLVTAIRDEDPVIFMEHKLLYMAEGPVPPEHYAVPFGRADIKRPGGDVTLVAWSNMLPRSL